MGSHILTTKQWFWTLGVLVYSIIWGLATPYGADWFITSLLPFWIGLSFTRGPIFLALVPMGICWIISAVYMAETQSLPDALATVISSVLGIYLGLVVARKLLGK